jgi:2-amino-4-hydroxy-6-hydroxymethyldihydropteridine diphosphokinase
MILIGLGSNLTGSGFVSSQEVLEAALNAIKNNDIQVLEVSPYYRSAPVPISDQPWFVNGVAAVSTTLPPAALLEALHRVEADFGRVRMARNESRTLDLDLLTYDNRVIQEPEGLTLPHPRLQDRAFVLRPLGDLAPRWRHPVSGLTAAEMLALLAPGQEVERIDHMP